MGLDGADPVHSRGMSLHRDLRRVLVMQAALWFVCLAAEFISRFLLHLRDPYQFFMLHGDATFYDFSLWLPRFRHLHTAAFFAPSPYPFLYPAPAALLYAVFLPFRRANAVYGCALVVTFGVAAGLFGRALARRGIRPRTSFLVALGGWMMAYPFWYCYQRGNIEMWVWAITASGAWSLLRRRPYLAAVCFGCAGAIKLYPLAWLGLFLLRRQPKAAGLGVCVAGLVTLVSLWMIYPEVAVSARFVQAGLAQFAFVYTRIVLIGVTGFDHSLYTLIKRFSMEGHLSRFPRMYTLVAGSTATVLFFTHIRRQPLAQQIAAVSIATILFPPVSFDYTLLHVYTALGAVLLFGDAEPRRRAQLLLLAVACSPLTEFIYRGSTFGGQIRALVLFALFLLTVLPVARNAGVAETAG